MARSGSRVWLRPGLRLRVQFLGLWLFRAVLLTAPFRVSDIRVFKPGPALQGRADAWQNIVDSSRLPPEHWSNFCMKKLLFVASSLALFLLGSVMAASSAAIVGTIWNTAAPPVNGSSVSWRKTAGV